MSGQRDMTGTRRMAAVARGRIALVLTAAAAMMSAGCAATARPSTSAAGTSTEIINDKGRGVVISGNDAYTRTSVYPAPVEQVWPALLSALRGAGVPVEVAHRASWTAGTPAFGAKNTFSGQKISTFLTCGGTAGVIEIADSYVITIGALGTLRPTDKGTELGFQVAGSAKDPFTSVAPRQCVSKGVLETRLDSAIRTYLKL